MGLSPRVRGNLVASDTAPGTDGSIPACAGEPYPAPPSNADRKVYPRVCGGTAYPNRTAGSTVGLSPRVRGNPIRVALSSERNRSIPACAGEPGKLYAVQIKSWVYPRVCGGTHSLRQSQSERYGLSPRVRGNPSAAHISAAGRRSIPACAGEPNRAYIQHSIQKVYPRVCGGTIPWPAGKYESHGLSPRVRGNQRTAPVTSDRNRSIPACAGEPAATRSVAARSGVYPRVCGGTGHYGQRRVKREGLSPRVRGNRRRSKHRRADIGSIPACAGEPRRQLGKMLQHSVYPRVCGGTTSASARMGTNKGLSPRVRGNR